MSIHINNATVDHPVISFTAVVTTTHGELAIPSDLYMTSLVVTLMTDDATHLTILTRDDVLITRHIIDGPLRGKIPEKLRSDIRSAAVVASGRLTTKICNTVDYVVDRVINETFKESDERAVKLITGYFNMPMSDNDLPRYLSRLFERIIKGEMNWAILSAPGGYIGGARISACNPMISEDDYSSGDELYI